MRLLKLGLRGHDGRIVRTLGAELNARTFEIGLGGLEPRLRIRDGGPRLVALSRRDDAALLQPEAAVSIDARGVEIGARLGDRRLCRDERGAGGVDLMGGGRKVGLGLPEGQFERPRVE